MGYSGQSPSAYTYAKTLHEEMGLARASLDKAAKKMKKWSDLKRRTVEFTEGDRVMVKLLPQQFNAFRSVHKGLIRRYEGPFKIERRVGNVSYRLKLPSKLKIHPVFHVSQLKPYHEDTEEPTRGKSKRAPMAMVTSFDKEVEEIISHLNVRRRGVPPYKEYFVRWKGFPTRRVVGSAMSTCGNSGIKLKYIMTCQGLAEDGFDLGGGECYAPRVLAPVLPRFRGIL